MRRSNRRFRFGEHAVIRAILWDNDGVLVDTEELYYEATREQLLRVGVALRREDFIRISLRDGKSVFELGLSRGISTERLEALREERNVRYRERLDEGVPVLDGVVETLEALAGRIPMAIVTSARREHFEAIHARTGLVRFFDFVLTGEDYTRSKPDPEPYLLAARRFGLPPGQCLVVEDSERGLASARAAGMGCVVVPRGMTVGGDYRGALRVFPSLREAAPYLLERAGIGGEPLPLAGASS